MFTRSGNNYTHTINLARSTSSTKLHPQSNNIYLLLNSSAPVNADKIFYVGNSKNTKQRLQQHLANASHKKQDVYRHIQRISPSNVHMAVIDTVPVDKSTLYERIYYELLRPHFNLTNCNKPASTNHYHLSLLDDKDSWIYKKVQVNIDSFLANPIYFSTTQFPVKYQNINKTISTPRTVIHTYFLRSS